MQKVFLTGASSGIGLATLNLLSSEGFEIWAASRHPEKIGNRPGIHPVTLDLNDLAQVENTFAATWKEAGHFDILINNAGFSSYGSILRTPGELATEQMRVMYEAPLLLTKLAATEMLKRSRGTILNVTSLAVRLPIPFMVPYCAAKAALNAATQAFRLELAHTRLHIVELQPGDINTPFHEAMKMLPRPFSKEETAAYQAIEREMKAAPSPDLIARKILKILRQQNPPALVTAGSFLQTKLAPLGLRFLPDSWMKYFLSRHYGI